MSATVSRNQVVEAVKILGLDPNAVLELHIYPQYVTGTEIVKALDGIESKRGKVTILPGEAPRRGFHMKVNGEGK
ncbi:hypothetical protein [Brevibacterium linens]|uniref:Uncharacterized protein n=1 Tax=Brevibacterium linens TaxID=1703 RepID=A0A0B9A192_BRELN|nr:hypothetical protein [Brevibacterium linens]KHS52560.1 hypothetical protein AE0388_1543 [Brevibacterium linens]